MGWIRSGWAAGVRRGPGRGGRDGRVRVGGGGVGVVRRPEGVGGGRGGVVPLKRVVLLSKLPAHAIPSLFGDVLFLFAPSRAVLVLFRALAPWNI